MRSFKLLLNGRQRPTSFPRTAWASLFLIYPSPLDPGLRYGVRGPSLKPALSLGRFRITCTVNGLRKSKTSGNHSTTNAEQRRASPAPQGGPQYRLSKGKRQGGSCRFATSGLRPDTPTAGQAGRAHLCNLGLRAQQVRSCRTSASIPGSKTTPSRAPSMKCRYF